MARKNSRITERWKEATDEMVNARTSAPKDTRFSWEKAQEDVNLPSYESLVADEPSDAGFIIQTAPTNNPKRPRAQSIGYNPNTNVLVIIFRDGTWWQYNDISPSTWLGLRSNGSTSDYLPVLESECSSHGPAEIGAMSEGVKAQLSQNASISSDIQNGDSALDVIPSGFMDIRNMSAEEMFKGN